MRTLKRALAAATVGLMAFAAVPAFAQIRGNDNILGKIGKSAGYSESDSDVSGDQLPVVIGNIIKVLLSALGIVFLVLMVYAGFLWMTARGDSKAVDKAKDIIKQAVIGMIITSLAYAITGFVVSSLVRASSDICETDPTNVQCLQ